MKLVKNLGMKNVGQNVYRKRYGLFKCPDCGKEIERIMQHGDKAKNCGCNTSNFREKIKKGNNRFFNKQHR